MKNDRDSEVLRLASNAAVDLAAARRDAGYPERRELNRACDEAKIALMKAYATLAADGNDATAEDLVEARAIADGIRKAKRIGDMVYNARRLVAFLARFA